MASSSDFYEIFAAEPNAATGVPFARFMELAMYHPTAGYYTRDFRRVGRDAKADFFTATSFNPVFGATLNPYDLTKTCGGSSGGAAVALACRMLPIADGSDMGGSLRNPASFCGVVGMRPSIGRVAYGRSAQIDRTISVHGPMARNLEDLALLLDAMSGEHPADPLSLPALPVSFRSHRRL